MSKEDYALNGQHFSSYEEAEKYATTKGWKIIETEMRGNIHLLEVVSTFPNYEDPPPIENDHFDCLD